MKTKIKIFKMNGLGNDFVMIDSAGIDGMDIANLAKNISNRHLGVGCDQLIFYRKDGDEYIMEIYNQDGSTAEACGNATRCLAWLINSPKVTIKVLDRRFDCILKNDGRVEVDMGPPAFNEAWMPSEEIILKILSGLCEPQNTKIACVGFGNPHLVIVNSDFTNEDHKKIGGLLERHKIFSKGVNVNFARINEQSSQNNQVLEINLRVWERGSGFTLACGSGACATFAALRKLGFIYDKAQVKFELGELELAVRGGNIFMTGDAHMVAKGYYYYEPKRR